ncbi:hypothetical protein MACK_000907 [Theileria orientalis]|uniref:Uncharacterized protein n=1 Tax=Theileria orientalis TaxID=68886 RepID=A0A976MAD2_THEOR|nr:hypothetical protein MACK_000907 [Theileria orientalis]
MLSSKHIFTILVTIVIAITYKPCETINNVNNLNKIKLSFLQKDADSKDTPDTVKTGETVDVVTNKDGTTSGPSKESSVDSHTATKEVEKHDQDKTVGEPTKEEKEQAGDSKKGNEEAGSEDKKPTEDTEGSESSDKTETSKEAKVEVVKDTAGDQNSHVGSGTGGAKQGSGSDNEEHDDQEEQDDHHDQVEEHEEDDSAHHKDNAGDKEEDKESGESENQKEPSGGSQKTADGVESNQTEAEAHAHHQEEHKPAETTDVKKEEATADHNQPTTDTQTADAAGSTESAPSKEATPEQTVPSNEGSNDSQVHEQASETHQENAQVVGETQPHQQAQTPEANHVVAPAPTQPSTNTENVVKDHVPQATDTLNPAQETGTSVAHQGNDTQVSTSPQTPPKPVDLDSLTDDEKKAVVEFWKKPSGDCSVDCTHSCRSALQGATQCVSVSDNSLSCSTFGDSATLTCPEGYTPCTQPVASALKSYTVKNNAVEVGALEVDGSNFSKCMGLALTTPDGRCDKATLVANLLFTAGALNKDYEINVAADKLTFGNLKIKNGDYKVCIFQRYEGSLEGMTISNMVAKLLGFINPTSSTPSQTRSVFVMEVGTLRVSD